MFVSLMIRDSFLRECSKSRKIVCVRVCVCVCACVCVCVAHVCVCVCGLHAVFESLFVFVICFVVLYVFCFCIIFVILNIFEGSCPESLKRQTKIVLFLLYLFFYLCSRRFFLVWRGFWHQNKKKDVC